MVNQTIIHAITTELLIPMVAVECKILGISVCVNRSALIKARRVPRLRLSHVEEAKSERLSFPDVIVFG